MILGLKQPGDRGVALNAATRDNSRTAGDQDAEHGVPDVVAPDIISYLTQIFRAGLA